MSNNEKPFSLDRTERDREVHIKVVDATTSKAVAVVRVRKAAIIDGVGERAHINVRVVGSTIDPDAVPVLANATTQGRTVMRESEKRPEGIEALLVPAWRNDQYVTFTTDGWVDGNPEADHRVLRPKFVPAGYHGHFWGHNGYHWDWDRNEVIYHIGTIVPYAHSCTRYCTADEFEVYDGNPYKDDPKRYSDAPRSQTRHLIDADGNRIEKLPTYEGHEVPVPWRDAA
jgi:hypothetical protein